MTEAMKAKLMAQADVSRETIGLLEAYEGLLRKWNSAINLVSPRTIEEIWSRHFLDSAQLFTLVHPTEGHWVDLGSGGGFPGLVLAVIAKEKAPMVRFTLVESDRRKATFLMTVARELGLHVKVIAQRIEEITPQNANYLSARALAPLDVLLGFSERHLSANGVCVFPKGEKWRDELAEAQKNWSFSFSTQPSLTDPEAAVLTIQEVSRV